MGRSQGHSWMTAKSHILGVSVLSQSRRKKESTMLLVLTLFAPFIFCAHAQVEEIEPQIQLRGATRGLGEENFVDCRLVEVDIASKDQKHGYTEKKCIPLVNGQELQVMLPLASELVESYQMRGVYDYVSISHAKLERGSDGKTTQLVTTKRSSVREVESRHLKQEARQPKVGGHRALMVRVTSLDSAPSLSAKVLRQRLFYDDVTPSSVLRGCSFDQFKLFPATGENIDFGLGEIEIGLTTKGKSMSLEIEQAITTAATDKFGDISRFDFVMFCIPQGSDGDWSAYTAMGYFISYYNDEFCGILSAVVHEIGHNLGLGHSGVGDREYADQSGFMGYGYRKIGGPAQCFNGYKSFLLGWYRKREVVVDPREGVWGGRLSGFATYDETDDAVLIIMDDLYIQFNLAVRANRETQGEPNRVTVTQRRDERRFDSVRVASLSLQDEPRYRAPGYQGESAVVIEVCEENLREGYVYVSIHLDAAESACRKPPERKITPHCADDTSSTFFVEEFNQSRDCQWLRLQKRHAMELCESDNASQARVSCPASCGLCEWERGCERERGYHSEIDRRKCILEQTEQKRKEELAQLNGACEDSTGFFHVNGFRRDCLWLSLLDGRAKRNLCDADPTAASNCPKSCGMCTGSIATGTQIVDGRARRKERNGSSGWNNLEGPTQHNGGERLGGSALQAQLTDGAGVCDDHKDSSFFVEATGKNQTCVWLQSRPQFIRSLCEASEIRGLCAETCGVCSDQCEDSSEKFNIGDAIRDCVWLSLRPHMQEELCQPGMAAYELCGETCTVCD